MRLSRDERSRLARELLLVAASLSKLEDLREYGEFSKGSSVFFHGFRSAEHLIKALLGGHAGRPNLTSISTPKGHSVPYINRIWFKRPTNIKIYPVFYEKRDAPLDQIEIMQKVAGVFGIDDWTRVQVTQWAYKNEQEWYHIGRLPLNKLDILGVQYSRRADEDEIERLHELCERWGTKCSTKSPW